MSATGTIDTCEAPEDADGGTESRGACDVCVHPNCDARAGVHFRVCAAHEPSQPRDAAELAALARDCRLVRCSNGWRIEHWTGAYLPVPTALHHPLLGHDTVSRSQFAPKWAARAALDAYRRGEAPGPVAQINGDGTVGRPVEAAEQPSLFGGSA